MSEQIETLAADTDITTQQNKKQEEQQRREKRVNKIAQQKSTLTYLAEKFPQCFVLDGEARPLKIGIFQDLVEALGNDENVSNTQLRQALRHYTSNWRYLHGCKEGAVRIDLNGNDAGILELEHVEHAQKELAQAKARVAERQAIKRTQKNKQDKVFREKKATKKENMSKTRQPQVKSSASISKSAVRKEKSVQLVSIDETSLEKGQVVNIRIAEKINKATVVEVMKESVRVQLDSGMTLNVAFEHVFRA